MLLALLAQAHAACTFSQTAYPDHVEVVLRAGAGRLPCRTVTLTAEQPLTVEASLATAVGRTRKLRGDALREVPGGGWEIHAPQLGLDDEVHVRIGLPADGLQVALAPWADVAHPGARLDEVRTYTLDAEHPQWGFADPKRGSTSVRSAWSFTADSPAQPLPLPAGSVDPALARWAGGAGERIVEWSEPGAAPQGLVTLVPGSLTLVAPGVEWVTSAGEGVTVSTVPDGVRFDAPAGGVARWRVASVRGADVIPGVGVFLAGLEYRFARVSLPEPAVPVRLKAVRDPDELVARLFEEVHALTAYDTPGVDPLRPRPLNKAYRSGWASPVERALVLHRFLGQEKIPAAWVLTGDAPDRATLTGFDHLLVRATVAGREVWLDPDCRACAVGEIDPRWQGKPAIGGAVTVPRQPGQLVRRIRLEGTTFLVRFEASGAAGLWLRALAAELDRPPQGGRVATALGLADAIVTGQSPSLGIELLPGASQLDAPAGAVVLELRSARAPQDPFPGETPWDGGWKDDL